MSGNCNQKLKTLYLMRYFLEYTDPEHGGTISDIIAYLAGKDITAERKSLYADIELLRDFGMDIVATKSKSTDYRLMSREFEIAELKLLVDAVSASKFITRKKSLELVGKIESLASVHEAKNLKRTVFVDNRVKTMNESIYYSVDAIHAAITENKKISFKYYRYSPDKEKVLGHGGERYIVSPLSLVFNNENYYLYAYSDEHGEIRTYRVDRMTGTTVLDERRVSNKATEDFDPASHSARAFDMLSGAAEQVTLLADASLSTVIIDRFGKDVRIIPDGAEHFRVFADIILSDNFFGWLFGYGGRIEIVSPPSARERFISLLDETSKKYR